MPKCEACGGDGQIEYGAYRGDEAGPTRECRLCGGVITTTPTVANVVSSIGASAQSASGGLQRLAHSVSESGRRFTDLVITTEAEPHKHSWKEAVFPETVEYICECLKVAIFSRRNGLICNPADISEVDKLLLSSRTMTRFPRYDRKPEELAAKRLEQLRLENERQQREAEKHEHTWNHVQVTEGWRNDLTSRRVQFRCVGVGSNCSKVLEFNTGGGLISDDVKVKEPELSGLALRARNAALQDKVQRRKRGML